MCLINIMEQKHIDHTANHVIDLIDTIINAPLMIDKPIPNNIEVFVGDKKEQQIIEKKKSADKDILPKKEIPNTKIPDNSKEQNEKPNYPINNSKKKIKHHIHETEDVVPNIEDCVFIEHYNDPSHDSDSEESEKNSKIEYISETNSQEKEIEDFTSSEESIVTTDIETSDFIESVEEQIRSLKNKCDKKNSSKKVSKTPPLENDSENYLKDIKNITKELSKNMVNDVKDNIIQTQQYLQDNRYELLVDFLNYAVLMIDFINRIIYQGFILLQEKIMGKGNNFVTFFSGYYDMFVDTFVKKITNETINTLTQMEEKNGMLTTWNKYKKCEDPRKKKLILVKYFDDNDITYKKSDLDNISFQQFIRLAKT